MPEFGELGLCDEVTRAVADSGYTRPTPIQAQAIPVILAKRDLVGIAQTGTGKTAAFVLPMIHQLASGRARARMPRSIILSPTRELAAQTAENFEKYGKYVKLTMALIIGGVGMGDQEKLLDRGVDVLIATPGRLLDWFERGKILLGGVSMFVIDEADRMLDMGFIPDVERIASLLARREQTMLFSATMPKEVRRLAERFLTDPAEVAVSPPATTVSNIQSVLCRMAPSRKTDAVEALIRQHDVSKAIVFCNRKRDVGTVTRKLQRKGYNARDIHGDLDQSQRQATLDAFKAGEVDYLVATDVAARGLDISDMPVVINLDVPTHADDYVHRIGRTGRAGKKGRAFTFATDEDDKRLAKIEQLIGGPIPLFDPFNPKPHVPVGDEVLETAPPAEAEAPVPAKPAGRGRRRRKPASEESPAAVTAPAPVEPQPALRPDRPVSMTRTEARTEAERAGRRSGERRERRDDGRVVGMGDHVPGFLLREVPLRSPQRTEDE
ncbi:MAG: DEAD/DEAH box helicase [Pseudomonadota bacterium]